MVEEVKRVTIPLPRTIHDFYEAQAREFKRSLGSHLAYVLEQQIQKK